MYPIYYDILKVGVGSHAKVGNPYKRLDDQVRELNAGNRIEYGPVFGSPAVDGWDKRFRGEVVVDNIGTRTEAKVWEGFVGALRLDQGHSMTGFVYLRPPWHPPLR
jgi:hypothetical protein